MSEQMRPSFSQNAIKVLERRYLLKDEKGNLMETPEDMLWRVARAVAKAERSFGDEGAEKEWAERFFEMMARLDFLPNSPTLMNAGTPAGQLSACFVLPIGDSMEEIFDALKYTALVHKSGGGTGFNFSSLRPYGDIVKSTKGVASGPVSFMELFDHTTDVVKQGGMRRGANMGILNADHPDVVKFIKAKVEEGKLRNFNISIGATQKFMRAILNDGDWDLVNPRTREVVDRIKARYLFDLICEMAWKTGDPGMIFLDKIEASNPTPHLGPIIATNPCGEQPLLPFESCNLGSINLSNMISSNREIDWNKLEQTTRMAVRFLDDVIEINQFPIKEIADRTKATRKIGLGVMGWADVLFKARIPYDSEDALEFARQVMCFISKIGHEESSKLAEERGPFPAWKGSKWEESGLLMRNATVTTIAPTGTISLIAEVSSGIEPVFALAYKRKAFGGSASLTYVNEILLDAIKEEGLYTEELIEEILTKGSLRDLHLPEDIKKVFVTAHDIVPEWHVRMQAAFQEFTDNAVSKTINLPHDASVEDVKKSFLLAYELGCKGITIFRDRCKEDQVLYVGAKQETGKESDKITVMSVVEQGYVKPKKRPPVLSGKTVKIGTSYGNLYLTLNFIDGQPFEVFATLGKSGKDTQAHTEALGRLISLALRSGIPIDEIIKQLKGIGGSTPFLEGDSLILSLPDAIARGLEKALGKLVEVQERGDMCPVCGAPLIHAEGCERCISCDYCKCD